MITKQSEQLQHFGKKIDDATLKEVVSEVVEQSTAEWQSERIVGSLNGKVAEYSDLANTTRYNESKSQSNRLFGMCLYIEACRKYKITPTNYIGIALDALQIEKWINKAFRMTHNGYYREMFYRPMMYKLLMLNKI